MRLHAILARVGRFDIAWGVVLLGTFSLYKWTNVGVVPFAIVAIGGSALSVWLWLGDQR